MMCGGWCRVQHIVCACDVCCRLCSSMQSEYKGMLHVTHEVKRGTSRWSFLLMLLVQVSVGMVLNQSLQDTILDEDTDIAFRKLLFEYFGTFTRTMMTMYELTYANWPKVCRDLVKVNEVYGHAIVMYRCVLCFAFSSVIAAVFIAETNRVVMSDEELVQIKRKKAQAVYYKQLLKMFRQLDVNGDGTISWEEFQAIVDDEKLQDSAKHLDIHIVDLEHLFKTMDSMSGGESGQDGSISVDEFMAGVHAMRSPALSVDVINLSKAAFERLK